VFKIKPIVKLAWVNITAKHTSNQVFGVHMAVSMKTAVFWDVMPHNLVQTHHHFEEHTNANFREGKMCKVKIKYISPKHW
jgi:hypothetical protein